METGLVSRSLEEEIKQSIRPAWLKIDDAVTFSSIGRSKLYSLIDDGKIRSACLRERDKVRGTRIVNVSSLEAYISAHEDVWSEQVLGRKGRKSKKEKESEAVCTKN